MGLLESRVYKQYNLFEHCKWSIFLNLKAFMFYSSIYNVNKQ